MFKEVEKKLGIKLLNNKPQQSPQKQVKKIPLVKQKPNASPRLKNINTPKNSEKNTENSAQTVKVMQVLKKLVDTKDTNTQQTQNNTPKIDPQTDRISKEQPKEKENKNFRILSKLSRSNSAGIKHSQQIDKIDDPLAQNSVQTVKVKKPLLNQIKKQQKQGTKNNKNNNNNNQNNNNQIVNKVELENPVSDGSSAAQLTDEDIYSVIQDYKKKNMKFNINNNTTLKQKYENLKQFLFSLKSIGGKYSQVFSMIHITISDLFVTQSVKYQALINVLCKNGTIGEQTSISNDYPSILNFVNQQFFSYDNIQKQKIKELEVQSLKLSQQLKQEKKESQDQLFNLQHKNYNYQLEQKILKAQIHSLKNKQDPDHSDSMESSNQSQSNDQKEKRIIESLEHQVEVLQKEKETMQKEQQLQYQILKQCYSLIIVIKELSQSQQQNIISQIKNLTQDSIMSGILKQLKGQFILS